MNAIYIVKFDDISSSDTFSSLFLSLDSGRSLESILIVFPFSNHLGKNRIKRENSAALLRSVLDALLFYFSSFIIVKSTQ